MAAYSEVPILIGPGRFGVHRLPLGPERELQQGEALVRVLIGGICGSDLTFFKGATVPDYLDGEIPGPGYPIHEITGELLALGPDTESSAQPGDLVVGWASGFDGLKDQIITGAAGLATPPAGLAAEEAIVMQPLACVISAVERLGEVTGMNCAVIGLGPIGLLFAHVLKDRGARHVVGVDRVDRRDVAAVFAVDELHWSNSGAWATRLAPDAAPNIVVEAVGHQVTTLQDSLTAVTFGGTVYAFGINDDRFYPLDMHAMIRKNLRLLAGVTVEKQRTLVEARAYLERYPDLAAVLVTHCLDRAEVQRGFELATVPAAGQLKIVVKAGH